MPIRKSNRGKRRKNVTKHIVKYSKKNRIQQNLGLKTYTFCEQLPNKILDLSTTSLDVNGHLTITYGQSFNFAMLPQVAQYSNLFYQYRILKIVAELSWGGIGPVPPSATAAVTPAPNTVVIALNNSSAPILLINRNHNNINLTYPQMDTSFKTKRLRLPAGQRKFISLIPSCEDIMQGVGATTVKIPKYKQWFISDPVSGAQTVPHYGFNIQVDTYPAGSGVNMGSVLIKYKMYFQCKHNE